MTLKYSGEVKSPLKISVVQVLWFDKGTLKRGSNISANSGTVLPAELHNVIQTSDATPGECFFTLEDPVTAQMPNNGPDPMVVPEIGDEIAIVAHSVDVNDIKCIFKGFVIDVAHNKNESGNVYSVKCTDMKARMTDTIVTKSYNEIYQIASRPNFTEKDREQTPFEAKAWTVEQIIDDLIDTANKHVIDISERFQPLAFFEAHDIDYTETDDLKTFVPSALHFENITLLEALYRTITSAGAYRLVYDPETDKLIATKLSTKASHAGPYRTLRFAQADKHSPNEEYIDDGINVISDNSSKRTSDLATIFRAATSKIEWYTGHYYIAEGHYDYEMDRPNNESRYYLPLHNWDGYKYHPPLYTLSDFVEGGESDERVYAIVGCPLYPQWDPLKGYQAFEVKMNNVINLENGEKLKTEKGKIVPITDDSYRSTLYSGTMEREGYTQLDKTFPSGKAFEQLVGTDDLSVALGFTYEAWFPWPGACAYCEGTGAVSSVPYSWKENAEEWFGFSRDNAGRPDKPMMSPFDYGFNEYGSPTRHPVPWENTCPACRGAGREPRFKITNIINSFMDVPPDKTKIADSASKPVTQMTWDQMVQDLDNAFGPKVQMEKATEIVACDVHSDSNMPQHSLAGVSSLTGPSVDLFPVDKRHPYNDKIHAIYRTQIAINVDANIDHKRGNVVFNHRAGITCRKPIVTIKTEVGKKKDGDKVETTVYHIKDEDNKTVYVDQLVDPRQYTFWRPARAWISCYFTREKFFDDLEGVRGNPATISMYNPDEERDTSYRAAMQVWDGMAVYEIKDSFPDDETEFNTRPVIKGISMNNMRWQIYPDDAHKLLFPLSEKLDWSGDSDSLPVMEHKAGYWFTEAAVHTAEPLRNYEAELLGKTVKEDGIMRNNLFGKPVKWLMRDDRAKLIKVAVKELERRNNIQITGHITIRGTAFDLSRGMGYVTFEDGLHSCIVKIEHDFSSGGFVTHLELSTEEMRLGQPREEDLDYKRQIDSKLYDLFTNPYFDKNNQSGTAGGSGKVRDYDPEHLTGD